MELYVVRPGDTLYTIAADHGVPMAQLIRDNGMPDPSRLCVGQVILIRFSEHTYTVHVGDTLSSIARDSGLSLRQLLRRNFGLSAQQELFPGETLVLSYRQEKLGALYSNSYAYPNIQQSLLRETLPYLSELMPFTCGLTETGAVLPLDDSAMIGEAVSFGVRPVLHLSALSPQGNFSGTLASHILNNPTSQDETVRQLTALLKEKGYGGLDVDFEYLPAEDAAPYAAFIERMHGLLAPMDMPVMAALAPKTFALQPGLLYEGHDYAMLGRAADRVLLMTYEWGYAYGPPMAVAPIRNVRQVVEFALTQISAEKIRLGIPTYGYDWTLPYAPGSRARSLSNPQALALAAAHRADIRYDHTAQSPWFYYTDEDGRAHQVWFEDARSIAAKLALIREYGLSGAGFWNLMRPFPQCWVLLDALYEIRD